MQNITEILKALGIEVPADKETELNKLLSENYKTVAEFEKKVGKVEGERDDLKAQLETAQATLKGFEGVDLDTIQRDLADYKKKAEDAEREYKEKLEQRDFEDALKGDLSQVKFSSEAAKKAVMAEITGAGLKVKDGHVLGLSDLLGQIKERDASAFVDESAAPPARFTGTLTHNGSAGKKYASWREVMDIKDATERQAAIAENQNLFTREE